MHRRQFFVQSAATVLGISAYSLSTISLAIQETFEVNYKDEE